MHEPLPRNWRTKHEPNVTLVLVRVCAFVVILAVVLVGVVVITGEFSAGGSDQSAVAASRTTGNVKGGRDAAPSNDLFSGMPLP
jgi:hypothetical protein